MSAIASWGVNEWVAATSAALALISFAFNWMVVRRQNAMQYESLRAQTDSDVGHWAHEAITLLAEAIMLARGRGAVYASDEFRRRQLEVSQRLSAMADRGRLFFPNQIDDSHGAHKEAAFQGYRPPILDTIVFAHQQVERLAVSEPGPDEEAVAFLVRCRRLLVSEVQGSIDPRGRGRMLARLAQGRSVRGVSGFAASAELGEALEARYPGVLLRRRDAAWIAEREQQARRA